MVSFEMIMVGVHNLAMHQLRTARHAEIPHAQAAANLAVKLTRMFAAQVERLDRHRGKGQQRVTVEHVQVNAGGQAIVGSIEAPRRRRAK